jgi:hypothetical protein
MAIHRRALEERGGPKAASTEYLTYARCLVDTFGQDYLDYLESWLEADQLRPLRTMPIGSL